MEKKFRTYSELVQLPTFKERFQYLKLDGRVGLETFGYDRYLNQAFYKRADEWKKIRRHVILRDSDGDDVFDMGVQGRPILGRIYVHHMTPITKEDILSRADWILDPEFLISVSFATHNAIHYGDETLLLSDPVERKPNDTCPWR